MATQLLIDFTNAIQQLISESNAKDQLIADLKKQIAALTPVSFTWDNLNKQSGWIAPANVGDTGGGNTLPAGTGLLTLGSPLTYRFNPAHAYNNAYVYLELEKRFTNANNLITPEQLKALSSFKMSIEFSLPQEKKVWQAIEFELQYASGGWIYNMAWQILATGHLRAFQYITKQWVDTGLICNAAELDNGNIMRLIAEFHVNQNAMAETHTRLTVDGLAQSVNFNQPAQSGAGEYLHCAFQLDTNSQMNPYTLAVGNIKVEVA